MTREKLNAMFHSKKFQDIFFIFFMVAWPVAIFLIFYVYVNINMVVLSFQRYDIELREYVFTGFDNYANFFKAVFTDPNMGKRFTNSFIVYGISLLTMPLHILVANHIYKKFPGAKILSILLFLPSIIPGMVWNTVFRCFVEEVLPHAPSGFSYIMDDDTTFWTLIIFGQWTGFASGMILYTGAMSRVPKELVEYGELDGLKGLKEFWHLTVPLIFPTITVFLITGISGLFTNQLGLFEFHDIGAPEQAQTIGYYFFANLFNGDASKGFYAEASASGFAFTLIVAPITMIARYLLEKYGPSAEF